MTVAQKNMVKLHQRNKSKFIYIWKNIFCKYDMDYIWQLDKNHKGSLHSHPNFNCYLYINNLQVHISVTNLSFRPQILISSSVAKALNYLTKTEIMIYFYPLLILLYLLSFYPVF